MKSNDIRICGLMIFGLSLVMTFYIIGMFHEYLLVSNLLLMIYLFGITTVIGLLLVEVSVKDKKKEKRKYVQKKKEKA